MDEGYRILVVDDQPSFHYLVTDFLVSAGYTVVGAENAQAALEELARRPIDLILSDLIMPESSGIDLMRQVHGQWPEIPFILVTGHGTIENAVAAMKEGAKDYLLKPLHREELLLIVERTLEHAKLQADVDRMREVQQQRFSFQNIRSVSPAMEEVLASARKVAAHPRTTVAIFGESGVGKEVLARAIHLASGLNLPTFVPLNCAAIPETLLESELFGHVKGAFTGANIEREGKCARARNGTLFLDEIGDMPLVLQAKLLRLLENRVYEKIGGDTVLKADFRIIIATHRDLEQCCREGTFRLDLLHRLNTFPLTIPPLRERTQDIPQLAEQFMAVFREHHGKRLPGLSQAALDQMLVYPWPGNIRELRNCLEYAAIVAEGALIRPEHLRQLKGNEQGCRTENSGDSINLSLRFTTEEFSYDAVRQALLDWAMEQSNQNKSSAARLLKASRKLFY